MAGLNYTSFRKSASLIQTWLVLILITAMFAILELSQLYNYVLQPVNLVVTFSQEQVSNGIKLVRVPLVIFESRKEQQLKIRDLEIKYAAALSRVTELERVEKENERLKELVSVIDPESSTVITRPLGSFSKPIILGGSSSGITQGKLVTISGQLLGIVTNVFPEQSEVTILSSPDFPELLAQTEEGVQGIVVGTGESIELRHLPVTATTQGGQRVMTVGQAGIPPGLLIGVISQPGADQSSSIQSVVVEQPVRFYELDIVEVQ